MNQIVTLFHDSTMTFEEAVDFNPVTSVRGILTTDKQTYQTNFYK